MEQDRKEEVQIFLTLSQFPAEKRRSVTSLLAEGKTALEAMGQTDPKELFERSSCPEGQAFFDPEREIDQCLQKGIDFLVFTDPAYPRVLKEIADPPLILYKKGNFSEDDRNAIAVVGTRHPSFYGRTQAKRFSQELASKGLTIVSGLARGIDRIAHEAALGVSYGRTIAVMGCGLDIIYPKEHEELFRIIAGRGVVLSEYPLGTPPLPENFPKRNRILSGLSYATLVIEAHSRSGSLITAHQAVEQGREVFAVPGPVDQLTSHGTHRLIREGAVLVETPGDILLALADRLQWENPFQIPLAAGQPTAPAEKEETSLLDPPDLQEEHETIQEILQEEGPLGQDEILEFSGLDPAKLPVFLLRLEIARKIRRQKDGKYALSS